MRYRTTMDNMHIDVDLTTTEPLLTLTDARTGQYVVMAPGLATCKVLRRALTDITDVLVARKAGRA